MRLALGLTLILLISAGLGMGAGLACWLLSGDVVVAESNQQAQKSHWVESGQSLWVLARLYYPDDDPRDIVHELRQLNNLSSATIYAGQKLQLLGGHK